jgi:chemotaxis response regulator CheB
MTSHLRVLLVEDSKVLAERLTEAITQISEVELVAKVDTEAAALDVVRRALGLDVYSMSKVPN